MKDVIWFPVPPTVVAIQLDFQINVCSPIALCTIITLLLCTQVLHYWISHSVNSVKYLMGKKLTFGTEVWKFMLVTRTGAEDSMEMITTSTSGRHGGESRAKWKRTRRLCPSNTVTGNRLPGEENTGEKVRTCSAQLHGQLGGAVNRSDNLLGLMDSRGTKTSVRVVSAGVGSVWVGDVSSSEAPRLGWEFRRGPGVSEVNTGMGLGVMLKLDLLWRSRRVGLASCLSLQREKSTHNSFLYTRAISMRSSILPSYVKY